MSDEQPEIIERIHKVAHSALEIGELLPCRVDEMTDREHEIFNIGANYCGALQFIRDLTDFPKGN